MKDGRHVGLDFYDLLIEPISALNAYVVDASVASPGRDWAARWGPDTAGESLSDKAVFRPLRQSIMFSGDPRRALLCVGCVSHEIVAERPRAVWTCFLRL